MHLRRERHTPGIDFNMTPLIDIVFLLIIFLMTVQEFSRLEIEEVDLPRAEEAQVKPRPRERVVVNVLADGRLVVAGRQLDLAGLWELLRRERERLRASGAKGSEEQMTVVIRADGSVPYGRVQELLSAAASLDIWRVKVAALPEAASAGP